MFSLCLTLKVKLSKSKIKIALKGPLKSFLDKISKKSIPRASKKPMAPTRSDQKIQRNLRIPEN